MIDRRILLGCIGMLFVALLPLPYAYYMILRVVIFGVSVYIAAAAFSEEKSDLAWIMAITALVYNPVIPVHMMREAWAFINLLTIGLLGYLYKLNR